MQFLNYLVPLIIVIVALVIFFYLVPVGLWISALAAGVKVSITTLIGMRLRRVEPASIILPLVKATKAGLDLDVGLLEAHYLAGGNVDRVVNALIAAERAGIPLSFERACA
ncbi:MAG: flotillin-like FloA family protein, partial [Atribacterota bacterium]|nr:flotillin-like FloA family protein [Atribacterota bacterium]